MARNDKTVGYTPATGRRGRRFWVIVAGIVLLLGLQAAGWFFLGRATSTTPTVDTLAPGNMPTRNGIPVPARHSKEGAVTAAQNFQIAGFRVLAGTLDAQPAAAMMLSGRATPRAKEVLAAPTRDRGQLAQARTSYAPLSAVVESYTGDRAVVLVWGVAASTSKIEPEPAGTEDWGRTTITLAWQGTQWRVVDQEFADGPWPAPTVKRLAEAEGEFGFRFREMDQWWSYVPNP